jgi:subfamily B ATP-binding cassette protein MsbA
VLAPGAWQTYRRLLSYVRPHLGAFVLGVLGAALFAASMAAFAAFAKKFGDIMAERDPDTIIILPLALIGLFILRGLGDFVQTYCMGHVGRHVVKRLRSQIFERMMQLPIGYYDRNSSSVLLSRLTYNTEQVGTAATDSIVVAVRESLTVLLSIGYLFYTNARLAAIAMTMDPMVA